ncbi:RF-1 domain containing protein, putative [Angomonas deanei]|uniref:RF-1 domain containing protein, putative n=1 Tax=Angomonas deanei TaxID=59799 RepID=A0A7G2C672_9TRYP|nr:RF-1 domain containing protein, putative [Angomonas deanei]
MFKRILPYGRVCVRPFGSGTLLFQSVVAQSPLCTPLRGSKVSSYKEEGYYRLDKRQVRLDPSLYEIKTMRGSGPGGQGVNSSSNKVELRISMEKLAELYDEDIIQALCQQSGSVTADLSTLIVSSHDQRSALQNKEACIDKVKDLIVTASWVPPVEADPIEKSAHIVTQHKEKRRVKSNKNRMVRSARKGQW